MYMCPKSSASENSFETQKIMTVTLKNVLKKSIIL